MAHWLSGFALRAVGAAPTASTLLIKTMIPLSSHPPSGLRRQLRQKVKRPTATPLVKSLGMALRHPVVWLSLALVLNVLEGAVRKWVPGFSGGAGRAAAYFSKEILFLFAVACAFAGPITRPRPALVASAGWGTLALGLIAAGGTLSFFFGFNPVGTVLSLRAMIILPCAAFLFASHRGRFPLMGFAIIAVALAMLNAPLALLQSGLPNDHILNKYAAGEAIIVEVESGVRATGTFAYITGLGIASALGVWGGMVIISLSQNKKQQTFGALAILAGFGCAFASISRGTFVVAVVMLVLWALGARKARKMLLQSSLLACVALVVALLVVPSISDRFVRVAEGTVDRFESAGDSNMKRTFGQWDEMRNAITVHPLGTGLGTEQVGGNFAAKGKAGFTTYETQLPRIVAEFGVIGLLGFFALAFAAYYALQRTRQPSKPRWNMVVTATQLFVMGQLYVGVVYNHTASAAVWIVMAAVLAAAPVPAPRRLRVAKKRRQPISDQSEDSMLPEPSPAEPS
jgi:hypothetical protein